MDVLKPLALLVFISACIPELDDRGSLLLSPRLLAVRTEPAEQQPGKTVRFEALYAGPEGVAATELRWAFCTDPVSLDRVEPVSARCAEASGDWLVPFGSGATASGALPADGCRRFGPIPPDPVAGQPAARPVDPDATGGYYQPLRIGAGDSVTLYRSRIECGLTGATQEQAAEYARTRRANQNPVVQRLDAPAQVKASEHVTFAVEWAGTEDYLLYDPGTRSLETRRESIRVSWFATGGTFENERTAPEADASDSANAWQAPAQAGEVELWVVVRDDRGGVGWRTQRIVVVAEE